jgi:hypothetical protein
MATHIIVPDGFKIEEWVWKLSRKNTVFIKGDDGFLYRVLDLQGENDGRSRTLQTACTPE